MTVPRSYLGLTRPWTVGLEEPGLQANPSLQNCLTRFKFRTREVFFPFYWQVSRPLWLGRQRGQCAPSGQTVPPTHMPGHAHSPPTPGFQGSQLHQQPPHPQVGFFCLLPAAAGNLSLPLLGQVRTLRPRGADQSREGWLPLGQAQRLREGRPPGDHSPGSHPGLGMTKSGTLSRPQLE